MKDKYRNTELIHSDRLETPVSQQVSASDREIMRPFAIRSGRLVKILIPGLRINGASVPRPLWWFQSPWRGLGLVGFWGHDGDYKAKKGAKLKRDRDMHGIHKQYGMFFLKRWVIWFFVAVFGWPAWWRSPQDSSRVVYLDVSQEDEIRKVLKRAEAVGYIRDEERRCPYKHDLLEHDEQSILRGDIDNLLKTEAYND